MDVVKGQNVVVVNTKYSFIDLEGLEHYIGVATVIDSIFDEEGNEIQRARLNTSEIIVEVTPDSNLQFASPEEFLIKAQKASDDCEFKLKRANVAIYDLETAISINKAIIKK